MRASELIHRFQGAHRQNGGYMVRCNSHEDSTASLSIKDGEKGVLMKCMAGCATDTIVKNAGLTMSDLFFDARPNGNGNGHREPPPVMAADMSKGKGLPECPAVLPYTKAVYNYQNEHGQIEFQVRRFECDGYKKTFRPYHQTSPGKWDIGQGQTRKLPYHLPAVLAAQTVLITEGEKDADALTALGFTASCNPFGAGKWLTEYNEYFHGKIVIIFPDNDEPGRKHAEQVACNIHGIASEVAIARIPSPYKDVSEYIEAHAGEDEIQDLMQRAESWNGTDPKISERSENRLKEPLGLTLGELLAKDFKPREFIINGLARGQVGTNAGATNAGKTTAVRNLAICLACGKSFKPFTDGGKVRRVILFDAEDDELGIRDDFQQILQSLPIVDQELAADNILILPQTGHKLNFQIDRERIIARSIEFEADMIFIDTLTRGFEIKHENDNSELMNSVMAPTLEIAQRTNAAVMLNHHIGKQKIEGGESREAAHKMRGGSVIADQSKLIINIERDRVNETTIISCAKIKGRPFSDCVFKLNWETRWLELQEEMYASTVYELIDTVLADECEHSTGEIVEALRGKVSRPTIERTLKSGLPSRWNQPRRGYYCKSLILNE